MNQFYHIDSPYYGAVRLWGDNYAFQPLFEVYANIGLNCWDYLKRDEKLFNMEYYYYE